VRRERKTARKPHLIIAQIVDCDILMRHTYLKQERILDTYKNYWGTAAAELLKYTRTLAQKIFNK